ncbi:MAG TPA: c-type cytochrome [Ramlibacter sp.]|nr:c-type cytochrome [Ramlibacter sp.]
MKNLFSTLIGFAVACVTFAASAQAPAPATQNAAGGAKSIEARTAMCMGCHNILGYQASFPEVHHVPMIAGQNAKFIAAALTAYKNGDRKHPTMRAIAGSLSDQDITDISAYYSKLAGETKLPDQLAKQPDAHVDALLKKANCISCHGSNLSKPIDPSYPKIAGQHADYLFVALKAYKAENNPAVGRSNPIMGAMAKQFSHAELKALADYIGSLDGELKVVPESRFHGH